MERRTSYTSRQPNSQGFPKSPIGTPYSPTMPDFDETLNDTLDNLTSPPRKTGRVDLDDNESQKTESSLNDASRPRPVMTRKEGMLQLEKWCRDSPKMATSEEKRLSISQKLDKLLRDNDIQAALPPFLMPYYNEDSMSVDRVTQHLCKEGKILKHDICTPVRDNTYTVSIKFYLLRMNG